MNILAYCCASFAKSVQRAAGVQPLLSPPVTYNTFIPDLLMGRDLIYIKLHGLPNQPWWYGDDWTTALHIDTFRNVALRGTVIFIANCHLEDGPFLKALQLTGATIIGGNGPNYAQATGIIGADLLGRAVRQALERRARPADALRIGKAVLKSHTAVMQSRLKLVNTKRRFALEERILANQDALQFKIFT